MRKIAAVALFAFVPAAGAAYKCVDEKGLTQFGDTPPAGCAHVIMYEVSPSGHVIRRIDPTPTPDQLKVKEEADRRKAEADKVVAERQRKDTALLSIFASEKEFDTARDRNIEPLAGRIRSAHERMKAIDERLAKLADEMEFYKSGQSKTSKAREMPHSLVSEQERLTKERQALVSSVATNEREIQAQRERFERDKKRWIDLKSGAASKGDQAAR